MLCVNCSALIIVVHSNLEIRRPRPPTPQPTRHEIRRPKPPICPPPPQTTRDQEAKATRSGGRSPLSAILPPKRHEIRRPRPPSPHTKKKRKCPGKKKGGVQEAMAYTRSPWLGLLSKTYIGLDNQVECWRTPVARRVEARNKN